MNKHRYRLIFDKFRNMLVPVAELTRVQEGHGTASGDATQGDKATGSDDETRRLRPLAGLLRCLYAPVVLLRVFTSVRRSRRIESTSLLVAAVLVPGVAAANLVADPSSKTLSIDATANGKPVINIVAPNAQGLSHNKFLELNSTDGLVFNNSQVDGVSKIGGYVQGNANLAGGQANAILNEVTSLSPSSLQGTLEVFGGKADLLVANPNGIMVNGVSTVNANSLTLTTGKVVDATGAMPQFLVEQGRIQIGNQGANLENTAWFDVIAHTIAVNGQLNIEKIKLVAGQNHYDSNTREHSVMAGGNAGTGFAIDASAAGAMYGKSIALISTESGLGVRQSGTVRAVEDIRISAAGDVSLANASAGNLIDIAGHGIALSNQNTASNFTSDKLVIDAKRDVRVDNSIYANDVLVKADNFSLNQASITARDDSDGKNATGKLTAEVNSFVLNGELTAKTSNGETVSNPRIYWQNGKLMAKDATGVEVRDPKFGSTATLKLADIDIKAATITNNAGLIDAGGVGASLVARDVLVNKGLINSGADLVVSAGNLLEQSGTSQLSGEKNVTLIAGAVNNQTGMQAGGLLTIDAGNGGVTNSGHLVGQKIDARRVDGMLLNSKNGRIGATDSVDLTVVDLHNQGSIQANGSVEVKATGEFRNERILSADQDVTVKAANLYNSGDLGSENGKLVLTAQDELVNESLVYTSEKGGELSAKSKGLSNRDGATITAKGNLSIKSEEGYVENARNAVIESTEGAIDITARGEIVNADEALILANQQLVIVGKSAVRNQHSELRSTTDLLRIEADGIFENTNDSLVSAQKKLTITGKDALINQNSTLQSTDGGMQIEVAGKVANDAKVLARGNLGITGREIVNHGQNAGISSTAGNVSLESKLGTVENSAAAGIGAAAGALTIKASGGAINDDASIQARDKVTITTAGTVTNRGHGTIESQTGDIELTADGDVRNTDSKVIAGEGALTIKAGGMVVNAGTTGAELQAAKNLRVEAGALSNSGAKTTLGSARGDVVIETGGEVVNKAGARVQSRQGDVRVSGASLVNEGAEILAQRQLVIVASDAINNSAQATMQAGAAMTLQAQRIENDAASMSGGQGSTLTAKAAEGADCNTADKSCRITNRNGGKIVADSLKVVARDEIVNTGAQSQIIGARQGLTLEAASIKNSGKGAELVARQGSLNITATALENVDEALIEASNGDAVATTGKTLHNSGKATLKASKDLRIEGQATVTNHGGTLAAGKDLYLAGQAVDNDGGKISATRALDARVTQSIRNVNGGELAAGQAMTLDAKGLHNTATGKISAGKLTATIGSDGVINTGKDSLIGVTGEVVITATGAVRNSEHAEVRSDAGLEIRTGDTLANESAGLIAAKQVKLKAAALNNDAATIQGQEIVDITTTRQAVDNRNQAHVLADGVVRVDSAEAVHNRGGAQITGGKVNAKAAKDIDNASGAQIVGKNAVVLEAQNLVNTATIQAGTLADTGELTATLTGQLRNTGAEARLTATGKLQAQADGGISNQAGAVIGGSKVKLGSENDIDNDAATIKATDSIEEITARNVQNRNDAQILANNNIDIRAENDVRNQAASIKAGRTATVTAGNEFSNTAQAKVTARDMVLTQKHYTNTGKNDIQASENATLTLSDGRDYVVTQQNWNPLASKLLTINANNVAAQSNAINNPGSVVINATGNVEVAKQQAMIAGKDLEIRATGDIRNAEAGLLFAGNNLMLKGNALTNAEDARILAMEGSVAVDMKGDVTNRAGSIEAGRNISIDARELNNIGIQSGGLKSTRKDYSADRYVWGGDMFGTRMYVDIAYPEYTSDVKVKAATLQAGGDIRINQQAKKGEGATINNNGGMIAAGGLVSIDGNLNNKSIYHTVDYLRDSKITITKRKYDFWIQGNWKLVDSASLYDALNYAFNNLYNNNDGKDTIDGLKAMDLPPTIAGTISSVLGADWKAQDNDELNNRWQAYTRQPHPVDTKIFASQQSAIHAGQGITHTGGSLNNGAGRENGAHWNENKQTTVKIGSQTLSSVVGDMEIVVDQTVLQELSPVQHLSSLTVNPYLFESNSKGRPDNPIDFAALEPVKPIKSEQFVPVNNANASKDRPGFVPVEISQPVIDSGKPHAGQPDATYVPPTVYPLYETKLEYIDMSKFYGSEYFFKQIGYSTDKTIPVIGDAYFEHQLLMKTMQGATAAYLSEQTQLSNEALMQHLIDNGARQGMAHGLTVGLAPTTEQLKQIDQDIIWYVAEKVDGMTVLVPKVYLSEASMAGIKDGKKAGGATITSGGSIDISADAQGVHNVDGLIKGKDVKIVSAGEVVNAATVGGKGGIQSSGGTVEIRSDKSIVNHGGALSGKTVTLDAKNDIRISTGMTYNDDGSLVSAWNGAVKADDQLSLTAGKNIALTGASVEGGKVAIKTGGDLQLNDVREVSSDYSYETTDLFTHGSISSTVQTFASASSVGSSLKAGTLDLDVGSNVKVTGSNITAEQTTGKVAGEWKNETGQDFSHATLEYEGFGFTTHAVAGAGGYEAGASATTLNSGLSNKYKDLLRNSKTDPLESSFNETKAWAGPGYTSGANAGVGIDYQKVSKTQERVTNRNSQLELGSGSLSVGGTLDIGGADININEANKNASLDVTAGKIDSTKYEDVDKTSLNEFGFSIGVQTSAGSSIVDAVTNQGIKINKSVDANYNKQLTGVDDRMEYMSTTDVGGAVGDVALTALSVAGDVLGIVQGDLASGKVTAGFDVSGGKLEKETRTENINKIGGNIALKTTQGDINLNGVQIDGGKVALESAGTINVNAAKTTTTQHNSDWHASARVGAGISSSIGQMEVAAVSITASVGGGYQETNTNGTQYTNSQIKGSEVSIVSGKDLNLSGATVKGDKVTLDVQGDTRITSLQDESKMNGWNANASISAGASYDLVTQKVAFKNTGFNVSGGQRWDHSKTTTEQSGIQAGQLEMKTGGDLALTGAQVISDPGKGNVDVGGKIIANTLTDMQDKDGWKAGVGITVSGSSVTPSISGGRMDRAKLDADNKATIDIGRPVEAKGGMVGDLNTDKEKALQINTKEKVAGTSFTLSPTINTGKKTEPVKGQIKQETREDTKLAKATDKPQDTKPAKPPVDQTVTQHLAKEQVKPQTELLSKMEQGPTLIKPGPKPKTDEQSASNGKPADRPKGEPHGSGLVTTMGMGKQLTLVSGGHKESASVPVVGKDGKITNVTVHDLAEVKKLDGAVIQTNGYGVDSQVNSGERPKGYQDAQYAILKVTSDGAVHLVPTKAPASDKDKVMMKPANHDSRPFNVPRN